MLLPSLSVAPAAENLIFNSGFELGSAGFSVLRSRPLENFRGGFDPSGGAFPERKEVKSGQGALRLVSLPDQRLTLCSSEIELKPATRYTFSFWAKCNADLKLVWKLSSRQQEKEKLIVLISLGICTIMVLVHLKMFSKPVCGSKKELKQGI